MSHIFINNIKTKSLNLGDGWSLRLDGQLHHELKYKDCNSKLKPNGSVGENSITVSMKYLDPFRAYWVASKLHFAIVHFLDPYDKNATNNEVINNLKEKLIADTEGMSFSSLAEFIIRISLTRPIKNERK